MPVWLKILVSIAVKLGLPWLLKMFPWIPASVVAEIEALIAALTQDKKENRKRRHDKIHSAKVRIDRHLRGAKKCT